MSCGGGTARSARIPRPPNAFMLFANEQRRLVAKQHPHESNKEISCRLGRRWKQLSPEDRQRYFELAKQADLEHKRKYPGKCVDRGGGGCSHLLLQGARVTGHARSYRSAGCGGAAGRQGRLSSIRQSVSGRVAVAPSDVLISNSVNHGPPPPRTSLPRADGVLQLCTAVRSAAP